MSWDCHDLPSDRDFVSLPPPPRVEEDVFRRIVDSVRDYAIFLLDTRGFVRTWNTGAQLIKGYAAEEIIGQHFTRFYPQEAIARRWPDRELEEATRVGRFEDNGWRVRKDGSQFWANVVITAIRDERGVVQGFSKVTRDLTERRSEEERLRQSEERFRLLVDNVEDYAIFLLDPGGHVVTWNRGAQRLKGYSAADIVGRHFSVFYPEEANAKRWPQYELEQAQERGRFEDEGWRLRKDGSRFWANVVITALRGRDGGLRGFSKITRDLTERREHEVRLRESEERFRLLLEGVEDYAIYLLDTDGRVASWNSGAQRIFGYTAEEAIGSPMERFHTAEDNAAGRARDPLRRAALNRRSEEHGWRVRRDGTVFWAEVVITAMLDENGRPRGYAKVTRDLSERRRMEDLEAQGRHLTEFLAMLAHELRNPLAPIRNALGILALQPDLPEKARWSNAVIERQVTQLTRLVDDLLDVSRITRGKLRLKSEVADLNAIVERAVESGRPLVETRRHRLHVAPAKERLEVNADPLRLAQVFQNLLTNAAKYTPEGGDIWIESGRFDGEAFVKVRDNGSGIPSHMMENIFELFAQGERTLDRSEGGLGIGLTLARRIVALHGGTIVARSEGAGKGSEFEVRLPRLRADSPVG
jgi:PAS domain S-box-containing protein